MKECLVKKAREKCQCEDCKRCREFRTIILKQQTELKIMQIYHSALKDAGVVPKNENRKI